MSKSIEQKILYALGLIALYAALVLATYSIVVTARDSAKGGDDEGMRLSDNRPPIENCPAGVELWDCIRNADYARE